MTKEQAKKLKIGDTVLVQRPMTLGEREHHESTTTHHWVDGAMDKAIGRILKVEGLYKYDPRNHGKVVRLSNKDIEGNAWVLSGRYGFPVCILHKISVTRSS